MRGRVAGFLVGSTLIATSATALAHHSFTMFDQQNKIEIEGIVREYKFVSPHSFIVVLVKGADGDTTD